MFITTLILIIIAEIMILLIEGYFVCGRKLEDSRGIIKVNKKRSNLLLKYSKKRKDLQKMNVDMNNV